MKPAPHLPPMRDRPLISVIVPSFNQGVYIRSTIESCLSQDYRPLEIVIVDGASTDSTLEILKACAPHPEVRWLSEPDSGPVAAVNKGLALSRGQIGLIQSADDVSAPGAFRTVADMFRRFPDAGLIYSDAEVMDGFGTVRQRVKTGGYSLRGLLARRTGVPQPCAFFRMELALQLGGWDERFAYCPDTDLWFRMALSARVVKAPLVLGRIRSHEGQRDQRVEKVFESYERMVRESDALRAAPWTCRLAVRAGLETLRLRYNAGLPDERLCRALWKAVILHPPLLFSSSIPKHRLVPGYFRWAARAGAVKRWLGWRKTSEPGAHGFT